MFAETQVIDWFLSLLDWLCNLQPSEENMDFETQVYGIIRELKSVGLTIVIISLCSMSEFADKFDVQLSRRFFASKTTSLALVRR